MKIKLFWIAWLILAVCLAAVNSILEAKVNSLKNENEKNTELLQAVLPVINEESQREFSREIEDLKAKLNRLAGFFYPQGAWQKEGYDPGLLFVEDLSNVNQFLKAKAQIKELDFTELEFEQKLPSVLEAPCLLAQLNGLRAVLGLGIELGMDFKKVKPYALEKTEGLKGMQLAKNYLSSVCPKESIVEFLIQINEVIPKACVDSLLIQKQAEGLKMDLNYSNVILKLDFDGKDSTLDESAKQLKEIFLDPLKDYAAAVRGKSPFFSALPKQDVTNEQKEEEPQEETARFYHKGTALLKGREVVLIEDTLTQETLFLGLDDRIGNFMLEDFSAEEATLENIDDKSTIIIKRKE